MLHLDRGTTAAGDTIVSPENLAVTKTARVGINQQWAYAMGWVLESTPNGMITWHNGGTSAYGAYIGTALDKEVGVIVLTNLVNVGLPDAIGQWTFDRLLGNPEVDTVALKLEAAKAGCAKAAGHRPRRPRRRRRSRRSRATTTAASSAWQGQRRWRRAGDGPDDRSADSAATMERRYLQRLAAAGRALRDDRRGPRAGPARARAVPGRCRGAWEGITLTMSDDGQTVDFVRLPSS